VKLSYGSRLLWNIGTICQITWCHLLKDHCTDITVCYFHRNAHWWIPLEPAHSDHHLYFSHVETSMVSLWCFLT